MGTTRSLIFVVDPASENSDGNPMKGDVVVSLACLQSDFSLKIRPVLIPGSAFANNEVRKRD